MGSPISEAADLSADLSAAVVFVDSSVVRVVSLVGAVDGVRVGTVERASWPVATSSGARHPGVRMPVSASPTKTEVKCPARRSRRVNRTAFMTARTS
jgi:hypothetical protein